MKKADFSAKPGEMSWNECAAIGAFLKAQQNAKLAREQDAQNFIQNIQAFQQTMANAHQRLVSLSQFFTANTPAIIARPINFVLNTVFVNAVNMLKNLPTNLTNLVQSISQKLADISDKLTAVYGELKAAVQKKVSETLNELKKKVKALNLRI